MAVDSVMVVPSALAIPAGLSTTASPSSADATAAPARDVDTAPAPGNSNPPADAFPTHRPASAAAGANNNPRRSFMLSGTLPQPCDAPPAQCGSTRSRRQPGSPR